MIEGGSTTQSLFYRLTARPVQALWMSGLFVVLAAAGLTQLHKDTSVRAFIPPDDISVVTEDRITEIFGLSDPIAVALITDDGGSVFTPAHLQKIRELAQALERLSNVRGDRIASLASESSIAGENGAVQVEAYLPSGEITQADADSARSRWLAMPPHRGTLVAEDESGAVILADLVDPAAANATYKAVLALTAELDMTGLEVHVAGPAAVSAFLSSKIDNDARLMQPLVFVIVLAFIYAAFRSIKALLGPLVVLLGAAGGAMGIMGWAGIPYFAITNALPVILVAIAVADAIHVLSNYYQRRSADADAETRDLVVLAMSDMSRPITLTTLTTMAGFIGIGLASIMPPITWFAWFATLGVALAWVFSIVTLPNALVLLKLPASPAFASWAQGQPNRLGHLLQLVSAFSARHYALVLSVFAVVTLLAVNSALKLEVDRSQVENFAADEPIRMADEEINERFAGTSFLDIMIETDKPDGLLDARRMHKITALQDYFETLPQVEVSVGITDYLTLLHQAINERAASKQRPLPDDNDAIAQYLLVYEASGNPADFEEEIDYDYKSALIRGALSTVHYSKTRDTVQKLERYLAEEFNEPGMRGTLGGGVNITYHWMSRLKASHFQGVGLSLVMVLGMAIVAFRSFGAGLLSVIPVTFTVVMIYALMAGFDIYLEPATSMFAAISVGVGVDFAIHLVDRLRIALRLNNNDITKAIAIAVPGTARACFFNAAALGLGFSVMLTSELPMLQRFGGLVASAAFVSFLAGLLVVPACYGAGLELRRTSLRWTSRAKASGALLMLATLLLAPVKEVKADAGRGLEIATRVAQRAEGDQARRTIEMTLIDRRDREKVRVALVVKQSGPDRRLTRITYLSPKAIRNTTFLSHDSHVADRLDERWLFIPATRKVRRIPASDRGDYFLGTDFTFEDMQSDLKFDLTEYQFRYDGSRVENQRSLQLLSGAPQTPEIAAELGYGAFRAAVDEATWLPLTIEFFDLDGLPLKTIEVTSFEQIDGIWTATEIAAEHHQNQHKTLFRYRDVTYPESLPAELFSPEYLQRRLPSEMLSD